MKTSLVPPHGVPPRGRYPTGQWVFCIPSSEADRGDPDSMYVARHTFWARNYGNGDYDRIAITYGAVCEAVRVALLADDPSLSRSEARATARAWVNRAIAVKNSPITIDRPDRYPFTTLRGPGLGEPDDWGVEQ